MAGAQVVAAARPVAQVAQEQLAAEVEVPLHRVGELRMDDARRDRLVVLGQEQPEDPVERVGLDVALAEHEALARRHVELHAGRAGPVLPPVVLLLHQEEELREAPQRRAVLLLVVGERLQEPNQRHAAFVGDEFAHGKPSAEAGPRHRLLDARFPGPAQLRRPARRPRPRRRRSFTSRAAPRRSPLRSRAPARPRPPRRKGAPPAGRDRPRPAPGPGSRRRARRRSRAIAEAGQVQGRAEARLSAPKSISLTATRSPPSLRSCAAAHAARADLLRESGPAAASPPPGRRRGRRPS